MYVAACRIGDTYGCDALGIQYQQGLKDLCPASDLVEGMLNSTDRPPVKNAKGEVILKGETYPHFNEVDECCGLDALMTKRIHTALKQPPRPLSMIYVGATGTNQARRTSMYGSSLFQDRHPSSTT